MSSLPSSNYCCIICFLWANSFEVFIESTLLWSL